MCVALSVAGIGPSEDGYDKVFIAPQILGSADAKAVRGEKRRGGGEEEEKEKEKKRGGKGEEGEKKKEQSEGRGEKSRHFVTLICTCSLICFSSGWCPNVCPS